MAGNTYYSTGTASVANGGTTVTGSGTAWASVVQAGDLFLVPDQGLVAMITAVASNTSITIDAWPGTTISGAAYKIVFASDAIRQSERARRYAEIASQIANTGIGIDAFGDFTDRATYNTEAAGFAFLSFDGDGASITDPVIFLKNSSTSADWSAAVEITGPQGDQGEAGLIGVWEGPWLTATAYAVGDAVSQGGSSYICLEAHTSGTFSTDLAASKWEIVAQKGDQGDPGTNGTNGVDGTGLFSRVRAVAASNITIATALNDGDTIDGVTLATNDLVLVAGQSAPEENGVYVVGVSPARDSSFDTYDEHPGVYVSVMEGTTYADTLWRCTSNVGGTLNTTSISFSKHTGSGLVVRRQTFTSSGTYTPDAHLIYCDITCQGAGGGSGAVDADGAINSFYVAGPGGAGERSIKRASAADIGASKTVTIGAAGSAATVGNDGGDGGDTSVGSLCIAKGGKGGARVVAGAVTGVGGLGGTGGTGDLTFPGQSGPDGMYYTGGASSPAMFGSGSNGGSSIYGGGGRMKIDAVGEAATGYGAGGGASSTYNTNTDRGGAAGSPGLVIIIEYCSE